MPETAPKTIELELPAAPASVAAARHLVDVFARDCGVADPFSVRAAVSEAVANVVAHAYPDRSPGPVRLEAECTASQIRVAIEDQGTGMRSSNSPGLGFGLKLMRRLADEMVVEDRRGRGLRIEFRFQRRATAAALLT